MKIQINLLKNCKIKF